MPEFRAYYIVIDPDDETLDVLAVEDTDAGTAKYGDAVPASAASNFFEAFEVEWWNANAFITGTPNTQDPFNLADLLTAIGDESSFVVAVREDTSPVLCYDTDTYASRRAYWRANPGGAGGTPLYRENNLSDLEDGATSWDNLNAVAPAGALLKANNLSDLTDIEEAAEHGEWLSIGNNLNDLDSTPTAWENLIDGIGGTAAAGMGGMVPFQRGNNLTEMAGDEPGTAAAMEALALSGHGVFSGTIDLADGSLGVTNGIIVSWTPNA